MPTSSFKSKSSHDSFVPLKLAQRFIHVIDFNADPLTCISASSGTVSYDSLQTPAAASSKTDASVKVIVEKAKHCVMQPPHPPQKARMRRIFRDERLETPVLVDMEMFAATVKEQQKRGAETTSSQQIAHDWAQVSKQVHAMLRESSQKDVVAPSRHRKSPTVIFDLTVEVPTRKSADFIVTKRTVTQKMADLAKNGKPARDAHELTMSIFHKVPDFQ